MRCMINGTEYDVPTRKDGTVDVVALKKTAGIASNRQIIKQDCDGSNHVVNSGDEISAQPGDHYRDMPIHTRGV